jgi:putative toxin-antitoxin system antitoxin component (TIGR02293 family)
MPVTAVKKILGGEKTFHKGIQNRMDLIELCQKGVTKDALVYLAHYLKISLNQLAKILPVTERTIQRYSLKQHFSPVVSEHVIQIAEVAARGSEIFGKKDKFLQWMNIPNRALADKTPMSLLNSKFGADLVLDELGRIEHGVFS